MRRIESMIKEQFEFGHPGIRHTKRIARRYLQHAPEWWGSENKEIYDNLILLLPPATFAEVSSEIGEPKKGWKESKEYKETVFWSFSRKDYKKTNWWPKTASAGIGGKLTIRTANTIRRIWK